MLFNRGFDLSLYLIIAGDKKNKDLIENFIKIIPDEFYVYLRNEINNLEINYNDRYDLETKKFFLNDGFMYMIKSGINSSKLEIKLYRRDFNDNIEENYNLSLLYLDEDKLYNNLKDNFELGEFSYNIVEYDIDKHNCKKKFIENKYIGKRSKFNKLCVYSKNDIFKFGTLVDLNDIAMIDFNKDSLVRKREQS